tara:strand:- start:7180 stop:7587 length:408 start_codon:yes stop_codon:yes gene_type:complete
MILHTLTFSGNINTSLQPGDIIYYAPTTTFGGSGINSVNIASSIVTFGVCTEIFKNGSTATTPTVPPNSIIVSHNNLATPAIPLPAPGDYIMFSKNKEVNSSSVKGYYAEVKLVNASTEKIELFSISSEVSESTK